MNQQEKTGELVLKYKNLYDQYKLQYVDTKKRMKLISGLRLVSFILAIVCIYLAVTTGFLAILSGTIVLLFLFALLIRQSNRLDARQSHLANLMQINNSEMMALNDDYSVFENGEEFVNTNHTFTYDLDVFGIGSLFQYLNRSCSIPGKKKLAKYLEEPLADRAKIENRQEAVKELTGLLDWRQSFQATGMQFDETEDEQSSVIDWATEPSVYKNRKAMRIALIVIPLVTLLVLVVCLIGVIPWSVFYFMALLQLFIVGKNFRKVNRMIDKVNRKFKMLSKFSGLLHLVESEEFSSGELVNIQKRLTKNNITAGSKISKLSKIIENLDYRNNMIMGFILNSVLLWDLQCIVRLEGWKEEFQGELPVWFDAVSETDALACLANFSFNNPAFTFPVVSESCMLSSEQLGHPLISTGMRVNNDFSTKGFGNFVIITGANMAGKSTFLRTAGINMVLAMAGAPVCATRFEFTPIEIFTSMRTSDSLQKNESYFYAELARLKELILRLRDGKRIFIILDEILKGTNSTDKQLGSQAVLEQLIELKGVGIIATHDLALGELDKKYPENIRNLCFEIEIDGENIFFDYKLYDGITQKMNAILLMKQMGITFD